ncbi:MAG: ribonuclease H-like domain-containing protein [Bacteroidetes bacterium]|jgi:DNA polymerase elongation subunit (family B)|nr:ribonuclease H-like domain-containing protein [Bacteroidota bacterium]
MAAVVFDIETSGIPPELFDKAQIDYLMKNAEKEESEEKRQQVRDELIKQLNLWPLTAQVVAIALLNVDSGNGISLYCADEESEMEKKEGDKTYLFISGDEKRVLEKFWEYIVKFDDFVTFNGRSFDCPFVMLRSAILGIRPSRDLMAGTRYQSPHHVDLLEELTYHGTTRKFNLDFYCKSFGIESPKSHGITGYDINDYFRAKRYTEIADYCMGDVVATAQLYRKWKELLSGIKWQG